MTGTETRGGLNPRHWRVVGGGGDGGVDVGAGVGVDVGAGADIDVGDGGGESDGAGPRIQQPEGTR